MRFLQALAGLILFSAGTHLSIIFFHVIKERKISSLNYFKILELNRFFPGIEKGWVSHLSSCACIVGLYLFFFLII